MGKQNRNIIFTTVAIDKATDKLIEKLCKRYSLKKSEVGVGLDDFSIDLN